jgi:hypothetical protein
VAATVELRNVSSKQVLSPHKAQAVPDIAVIPVETRVTTGMTNRQMEAVNKPKVNPHIPPTSEVQVLNKLMNIPETPEQ